ncbi:DNA repair protein, partial [bacterium]|nr:DNA repair protein [bacterium]
MRTYFCIDMKSFYASVECAERGWNPFETNLVVADVTRGRNALCLAISPRMKALGVKNRCRLSDIPSGIAYEIAPPRMALYIEYAADIYSLYL